MRSLHRHMNMSDDRLKQIRSDLDAVREAIEKLSGSISLLESELPEQEYTVGHVYSINGTQTYIGPSVYAKKVTIVDPAFAINPKKEFFFPTILPEGINVNSFRYDYWLLSAGYPPEELSYWYHEKGYVPTERWEEWVCGKCNTRLGKTLDHLSTCNSCGAVVFDPEEDLY